MKRLMVIAALAVASVSCVANQGDASVRFLNARALELDDGCSASNDKFISSGGLDLSGGQNYLLALSVETNTFVQPVVIGQETVSGGGLGDVTLTELVYSYQVSGVSLPADEVDRTPIYAVFRPETNPDESYLFVYAFGPKALEQLRAQIGERTVTVLATIKARGHMSGGQTVETNEITFPVTVADSGWAGCPDGTIATGVCGFPGQDSIPIQCVEGGS
ncbi:hypothetical protein F0U61_13450 [Archangium violaceum]|uniref:hypothetical protein n=1 Tax=Archangium violaceum TaxID=83451 RepID=UPI002B31B245|nr:hypothetical protein F0U61_13450 [Archangium violaceum]